MTTGRYTHQHTVDYMELIIDDTPPTPPWELTIPERLQTAGYTTAAAGKIHCPEYWLEDDCDVFHETCGCSIGGRSPAYTEFLKERGKDGLEDHGRLTEFGPRGQQSMELRAVVGVLSQSGS